MTREHCIAIMAAIIWAPTVSQPESLYTAADAARDAAAIHEAAAAQASKRKPRKPARKGKAQ